MNNTETLTLKNHGRFGNCHPQYARFGIQSINWATGNVLIYSKTVKEFANKTLCVKFDLFGIGTVSAYENVVFYIKHCNGTTSTYINSANSNVSIYYKITDNVLTVKIVMAVENYKNFAIIPTYEAIFQAFSYKKHMINKINPVIGMGGFQEDVTTTTEDFSAYTQVTNS